MMNLSPRDRPDHSGWREMLAAIERLAREHDRLAAECDQLDLELGAARQQVSDLEAEVRMLEREQRRRAVGHALRLVGRLGS